MHHDFITIVMSEATYNTEDLRICKQENHHSPELEVGNWELRKRIQETTLASMQKG